MVQKISKRGVHSGNTLRASNSRFNRQYSRKSCLLRKSFCPTGSNGTLLDDWNIKSDDVIYSLNKKGRWELPEMLKQSILGGHYKDLKTQVKLVVSHDLKKKSHTIGFYASKGKLKKVEGKKKLYINGESVVTQANQYTEAVNRSTLQVEVLYPSPATSSVVHNPKYVGHCIDKAENGRGRSSSSRKQRQKLSVDKYLIEMHDTYDDLCDESGEDDEDNEDLSEYIYGSSKRGTETKTELLEDIMIHAALMQSLCERSESKKVNKPVIQLKTENKVIYENDSKNRSKDVEEVYTNINRAVTVMEQVFVVLPKSDVNSMTLKGCYGRRHRECACFPRKFLIDVTDRIDARIKTSSYLKNIFGNFDVTSCIIFAQDELDANNTESQCVFKVSMNIGTRAERFKILTLFDYVEGSLEDVIECAIRFVDMMAIDGLPNKEKEPMKTYTHLKFENLNKSQKVVKSETTVTRKSLYDDIFDEFEEVQNGHFNDFEIISSDCCGICFDELSECGKSGTALASCGHWFCDDCWIDHCRTKINMGSMSISCPEHGCSEIVDESFLLTFVNLFEVLNMKRRAREIKFERSDDSKWCPNPNCNRIIVVQNSGNVNDITCKCGNHICFQCLQPPHWPVPCNDVPSYWKMLRRLGDDISINSSCIKIRGKQCPKCKRLVEKNGGCYFMRCACGAEFCWGCLGLYPNHVYTARCNQNQQGDHKGSKSFLVNELEPFEMISNNRSANYQQAVKHRQARLSLGHGKLKAGVRRIRFKCKNLAKRKGPMYFSFFEIDDTLLRNIEVEEQINTLLMTAVSIYTESHHIAEYCYVLADKMKLGKRSSQFRCKLDVLGYYADSIHAILTDSTEIKDYRPILLSLKQILHEAPEVTNSIVRLIEKVTK